MKVSAASMKKLGFKRYGNHWQHRQFVDLCFTEFPSWEKIVFNAFQKGSKYGRERTQTEIKEALGIY